MSDDIGPLGERKSTPRRSASRRSTISRRNDPVRKTPLTVKACPCGKEFVMRSSAPKRRFCSNECGVKARTLPADVRFSRKVKSGSDSECWPWIGLRDKDGYGIMKVNGRMVRVHRFAWERVNGPVPPGMLICHHCDNPPCCNPSHLRSASPAINMADKMERGRWRGGKGESQGHSKLSESDVLAIRAAAGSPVRHRSVIRNNSIKRQRHPAPSIMEALAQAVGSRRHPTHTTGQPHE